MKHKKEFNDFLSQTVNLSKSRLDLLSERANRLINYLMDDEVIKDLYKGSIPQGSWAHQTIIRPLGKNDEFDADIMVELARVPNWLENPKEHLRQLRAAFKRSATYGTMVRKKNRCVRIGYANDCHVDIVPMVILDDGRQMITNYAENQFEQTNPDGFTKWMKEKDKLANGKLRQVIRLCKYLRDSKRTFSCPSAILTTLLGERVRTQRSEESYVDLPTALTTILTDLNDWLSCRPSMPSIEDPSCPGTSFHHRWSQEKYSNFREKIDYYASKVAKAYDEPDEKKSLQAWQEILGTEFKSSALSEAATLAPVVRESSEAALLPVYKAETRFAPVYRRAPDEEFITEQGYQKLESNYKAQILCNVVKKAGFRHGLFKERTKVNKDRYLDFTLSTDTPEPYEVLWKVRNNGEEAARASQLRGAIIKGKGPNLRERTGYSGTHFVEAYVIVNKNQCIAESRFHVEVE